jgi:hypothetical protein
VVREIGGGKNVQPRGRSNVIGQRKKCSAAWPIKRTAEKMFSRVADPWGSIQPRAVSAPHSWDRSQSFLTSAPAPQEGSHILDTVERSREIVSSRYIGQHIADQIAGRVTGNLGPGKPARGGGNVHV